MKGAFLNNVIGDRAFYRQVTAIVLPMIVQNTLTNAVSLLDNLMVGHIGTLPMSAVAIVNQLLFVFYICIWGGLSGPSIFSTQFAGAQDHVGVQRCFRIKWMFALGIVALTTAAFVFLRDPLIMAFLKGEGRPEDIEETVAFARSYLFAMDFSLLPFAVSMVYATTLRELGETKVPMLASITAIAVNVLFNYLMIFGHWGFPAWGVVGAAVATCISRYVEMAIILLHVHFNKARYEFIVHAYNSWRVPMALVKSVVRRGMPLFVNEVFWSSSMAIILHGYSIRGLHVIAACNIAQTVANVFNSVFYSMGGAIAIVIGHELGSSRLKEARVAAWRLTAMSLAMCLLMGGSMCAIAHLVPRFYETEDDVRQMATCLIWLTAAGWPFRSFFHSCFFVIRSGGCTYITSALDSGFTCGIVIPVTLSIAYFTNIPILPFYFIVQMLGLLQCVPAYLVVKSDVWARNLVEKTQ